MKNNLFIRSSVSILLAVLIAAMALLAGCTTAKIGGGDTPTTTAAPDEVITVGEGATSFSFTVTFLDGSGKQYTVKTDKTTVGEALLDAGLISGSESEYGLMVDTVDGVKLDYTADKAYFVSLYSPTVMT